MKILFINQAFYPDVVSSAQHLTDLAVHLAAQGEQVGVLCGRRGYTAPYALFPEEEIYKGVEIKRIFRLSFGRASKLTRILDAIFFNVLAAWHFILKPKYDVLVTLTSPPLVAWFCSLIAKLRGSRLVYWMMDINPDQAIIVGWIRPDSRRAKLLSAMLNASLKRTDTVIVLDDFMQGRILEKGTPLEKIRVVPPWAHDDDLESMEHAKNPFRQYHNLEGKFVIMYSGNHSICHPLDTLLQAAKELKDEPEVLFMFIGGGERVKDVLEFKEREKLKNITYLPYVERSQLKFSLSAADVHTVVMGDQYVGIVHPCKIYDILKIGRPIIYVGPEQSHVGEIIAEKATGIRVGHGDVSGTVRAILEFKNMDSHERNKLINHQKNIAKRYSKKLMIKKMADIVIGA